jgi:hypothetical protein
MRRLACIAALAAVAACGPEPPQIRDLLYSPNAGLVSVSTSITGSVAYSDPDNDVSQYVAVVKSPSGDTLYQSPPLPITSVGQGPLGEVQFEAGPLVPRVSGVHLLQVWVVDLLGQQSNVLEGPFRVSHAGSGMMQAPQIRDLAYSPNAALIGEMTTISGTVTYYDPDNDVSQYVVTLLGPSGLQVYQSKPTPISSVGQGVTGTVSFNVQSLMLSAAGVHKLQVFIIDLAGQQSNTLEGAFRVN